MVVVSQTLLTQNLRKLAWGLNSFFVGVEKNLCWVALKAMSILRTSLQRIIWRWEGGRDRGSTVHCTVQFSRNINSGHCLECHNGSHSENRDKPTSSKPFRKSSRQTMVREFLWQIYPKAQEKIFLYYCVEGIIRRPQRMSFVMKNVHVADNLGIIDQFQECVVCFK